MGGLALEGLNLQAAADNAEIWEKALRKLRGNQMPPPGSPQPPQKDVDSFVAWMENTLDTNAKGPKAGYVPIQRLNRTEYAASVKALVGVDVNPKDVLPQDIQVEGFDNIADALSVSPAFLDQYVTAARHVAQIAVGNPNPRVSSVKYPIAANQNPDDPPPLGTWGGIKFKHSFPADGEYQITTDEPGGGPVQQCAGAREHGGHHDRWPNRVSQVHRWSGGSISGRSHGGNRTRSGHGPFLEDSRSGESRRARRCRGLRRSPPCGDERKPRRDFNPTAD